MTGMVRLEDPAVLCRYAQNTREVAQALLRLSGSHAAVDPGPDGVLAPLATANERAYERFALYATDAYRGLGGLAWVADAIGVELPKVDRAAAAELGSIGANALASVPRPPVEPPRPDPRFVSPVVPG